jgi:hypothetical protein
MPSNDARAIDRHKAYPLAEFARQTGMNKAALRSARRSGLPVRYHGNKGFVLGADFLQWLDSLPTTAPSAARPVTAD